MACSCTHRTEPRVEIAELRRVLGVTSLSAAMEYGTRQSPADQPPLEVPQGARRTSARTKVDENAIWLFFRDSVYQSQDLPSIAVREAEQNSLDAVRAAIRAGQIMRKAGTFDVTWDGAARTLSFTDNGIGMDADTIKNVFLSLATSGKKKAKDSGEAAGGFGVAKAAILLCSRSFKWTLETRDNIARADGFDQEILIDEGLPTRRQGTRITLYDVDPKYDSVYDFVRNISVGIEQRMKNELAASEVPLSVTFNGAPLAPLFKKKGGGPIVTDQTWGPGVTASVKGYRRTDKRGAYYIRLGGLFQYAAPTRRGYLEADIVIDLSTTVRPGDPDYPLNAGRDALVDGPVRRSFYDLAKTVEKVSEAVGIEAEYEIYAPEPDTQESGPLGEMDSAASEALADIDFQKDLQGAADALQDLVKEQTPPGSRPQEPSMEAPPALPPGLAAALAAALSAEPPSASQEASQADGGDDPDNDHSAQAGAGSYSGAEAAQALGSLESFLQAGQAVVSGGGGAPVLTQAVTQALELAQGGLALPVEQAEVLQHAIERATDSATLPGGGGIMQAAAAPAAYAALDKLSTPQARPVLKAARRNPFGSLAGLRISKKRYDKKRARRFVKSYAKWMPYLTLWDTTLRLIATETRILRAFKPGFLLDDTEAGMAAEEHTGTDRQQTVIFVQPDRLAEFVRKNRERPIAIAGFLQEVATHELAHVNTGFEEHGTRHAKEWSRLLIESALLLPALSTLASKLLRLPPTPQERAAAALASQAARTKEKLVDCRKEVKDCRPRGPRTPVAPLYSPRVQAVLGDMERAVAQLGKPQQTQMQRFLRQERSAVAAMIEEQMG